MSSISDKPILLSDSSSMQPSSITTFLSNNYGDTEESSSNLKPEIQSSIPEMQHIKDDECTLEHPDCACIAESEPQETGKEKELFSDSQTGNQNPLEHEVEDISAQFAITKIDKRQVLNSVVQNGFLDEASKFLGEIDRGDIQSSVKTAWQKSEAESRVSSEPVFTMEASAWPTLAEARRQKPSKHEALEPDSTKKIGYVELPPARKPMLYQDPMNETPKHGTHFFPGPKYKPYNKRGNTTGKPNLSASDFPPMPAVQNWGPGVNMAFMNGGEHLASQWASGHNFVHFHKDPMPINSGNWHNNMQPHPGWQQGYGNCYGFNGLPLHGQHFGPMIVQQPFFNINPACYNIPNFQMMYSPAGISYNSAYFTRPGPPGGIPNRFKPMAIETVIQKQIEYYFSDANLPWDSYFLSLMDDEGFVPISQIAQFNRVRMLNTTTKVILEALKKSLVLEVKGDKIRRAYDWKKFLRATSQTSNTANAKLCVSTTVSRPQEREIMQNFRDSLQPFNGSLNVLPEVRLNDGTCLPTSRETAEIPNGGDLCIAHELETKNRSETDTSSMYTTARNATSGSFSSLSMSREESNCSSASSQWEVYDEFEVEANYLANSLFLDEESQVKTKDSVEVTERRLAAVTHAQMSSCVAVP